MNKLKEACIISHEHWLKELEQTIASIDINIPEIKIPEKKKDKQSKNKKNGKISKKVVKVLIIAAIIVSLLMTASAYRPFREFVVEFFDNYNLFTNNTSITNYTKEIDIAYIPKEFVLLEESVNDFVILREYRSDISSFIITKSSPNSTHQISNTYLDENVFYYNDIKYSLLQLTDKISEIVWLTDEYAYVLTGYNLEDEEIIKIAKNIS